MVIEHTHVSRGHYFSVSADSMIAELPSGSLDPEMARITGSTVPSKLNQAQLDHLSCWLAGQALEFARSRAMTLATAESCTGGGIAADLTAHAGSSDVFLGSLVTYSNGIKTGLLEVPGQIIEGPGAVSSECAEAMVRGLLKRIPADIGACVTGIAGPGGGSPLKPVGLVYSACSRQGRVSVQRWQFAGNRAQIRALSRTAVLLQCLERIENG
jgi:nicotinamide-nucleotide amidase